MIYSDSPPSLPFGDNASPHNVSVYADLSPNNTVNYKADIRHVIAQRVCLNLTYLLTEVFAILKG